MQFFLVKTSMYNIYCSTVDVLLTHPKIRLPREANVDPFSRFIFEKNENLVKPKRKKNGGGGVKGLFLFLLDSFDFELVFCTLCHQSWKIQGYTVSPRYLHNWCWFWLVISCSLTSKDTRSFLPAFPLTRHWQGYYYGRARNQCLTHVSGLSCHLNKNTMECFEIYSIGHLLFECLNLMLWYDIWLKNELAFVAKICLLYNIPRHGFKNISYRNADNKLISEVKNNFFPIHQTVLFLL